MSSMIIFGGSGGIGLAIAKMARRLNFEVIIADKTEPPNLRDIVFVPTDATQEGDVKRVLIKATEKLGVIDVVINCQGLYLVERVEKTGVQSWDDLMNVNLKSVFLVCKNIIPIMKWQGRGYIVNIASMAGLRGKIGQSAYCASKFGVVGLTEAIHEELKGSGVRISAVCPSSVDTPFLNDVVNLGKEELDKILQPEDIARVIAELITSHKRVHRKIIPIEIELEIDKLEKKKEA